MSNQLDFEKPIIELELKINIYVILINLSYFEVTVFFFDLNDLDAAIGAAGQADVVWSHRCGALRTGHQLCGLRFPVAVAVSRAAS